MLQAIQNNSCNYIENYTTKKDIGFGLLHKTAESSFAAPQALSKISDAAKQRACVYRPAFRSASTEKVDVYKRQLWHVVSFPTPETGGVTYLTERASAFERQHPYVYVDVIGMTPEEAEERKKSGESPDILSFPMGYLNDASSLAALEPNKNIESVFSGCEMCIRDSPPAMEKEISPR